MANENGTVVVPQTVNSSLEQLIKQREAVSQLLAKANAALYLLLGECKVLADATDKKVLAQACKDRGIEIKSNTHAYSLILYIVFADISRQKVSAYAVVLKKAEQAKLASAADVANWISVNNGIEAIRTGGARSGKGTSPSSNTNVKAGSIAASNQMPQISEEAPEEDEAKPEKRALDYLAQSHGGVELDPAFFPMEIPRGSRIALLAEPTSTGAYRITFITNVSSAVRPLVIVLGRELDCERRSANSLILSEVIDRNEAALDAAIQAAREANATSE